MMPRRIRSLAPNTRDEESAVAATPAASPSMKFRREYMTIAPSGPSFVSKVAVRQYCRATAGLGCRSGIMNAMSIRHLILTALFGVPAVFTQPADVILHHGKIVAV